MGKAKEIVSTGRLGGREGEELAFAAYEIGASLLKAGSADSSDHGSSNAIVWLLEASDLLENRDGVFAKDMHVSSYSIHHLMKTDASSSG